MNKTLLILILPIFLVSSIVLTDLYTTTQLNSAIESLAYRLKEQARSYEGDGKYIQWAQQPQQNAHAHDLQNFLMSNASGLMLVKRLTNVPHAWDKHKYWLNQCVKSPALVHGAISIYLPNAIRKFNSLVKRQSAIHNQSFDTKVYWSSQVESIDDYQRLITVLLELSDADLQFYLTNTTVADYSFEFNKFLSDKGLLRNKRESAWYSPASNYHSYPGDFLCLAHRVCENDSDWSYRRFLGEALKASEAIESVILSYVE